MVSRQLVLNSVQVLNHSMDTEICKYAQYLYCIKSNPVTGLDRPLGIQKVDGARFSRVGK